MLEKLEINDEAAKALLQSEAVMQELMRRAEAIKDRATIDMYGAVLTSGNRLAQLSLVIENNHFEVRNKVSPTRDRVSVGTHSYAAEVAEATDRTLTRALDAGRG